MTNNPLITLLVEDDPSWQAILKEILNDYALRTDCTDNLQNAIEMIRATNYRLAIVDLSLSGKDHHNHDGLEVLSAIQRFAPSCKGILLTGDASVEIAGAAIQEYRALTCLQKEYFRRSEFREIISKAIITPDSIIAGISKADTKIKSSVLDNKASSKNQLIPLALVVEDDVGWQSLLTELLLDSGFEVDASSSYGEALGLLNREQFKLAIADISLASSLEPENNQFYNNLTKYEIEVLSLLAQGLGNKEIAKKLHISTNTVKRHLKSIYAKLEVNTHAAASAYAAQQRIGTGI